MVLINLNEFSETLNDLADDGLIRFYFANKDDLFDNGSVILGIEPTKSDLITLDILIAQMNNL